MSQDKKRLPPHDHDAERAVIGSILTDAKGVFEIPDLHGGHFFDKGLGRVFDTMRSMMLKDGVEPDFITLPERLDSAGVSYDIVDLMQYMRDVPQHLRIGHYADIVRQKYDRRRIIEGAGGLASLAWDEGIDMPDVLEASANMLLEVSVGPGKASPQNIKGAAAELLDQVAERYAAGGVQQGLATGYPSLDKILRGIQDHGFYVLAARPGVGKTALGSNFVERMARVGKRVLFISMEMTSTQMTGRMVAQISGVPYNMVMEGSFSDEQWPKVSDAIGTVSTFNIEMEDTPGMTVSSIYARAKRAMADGPLDLIVVDHIGLMASEGNKGNRTNEVSSFSLGLKRLALSKGMPPVLAMSQLNRDVEKRQNRRPQLSDLRDSGSIEQDADVVMFMYRDDYYKSDLDDDEETEDNAGVTEVDVAKNRWGPTGVCELRFVAESGAFYDPNDTIPHKLVHQL